MLRNLLLGAALLLLAGTTAAMACSTTQPPPTTEEQFAKATRVLVARIVRTEEARMVLPPADEMPIVEGTVRVIEILKGQPPEDGKVRSLVYGPGNCTIPLLAGWDYVFFLYEDKNFVQWLGGSVGNWSLEGKEAKSLLEKLRKLSAAAK
jgi:hypothetical protein